MEDYHIWCWCYEKTSSAKNKRQNNFDSGEFVAHHTVNVRSDRFIQIMKKKYHQNDLRDFLYLFLGGGTMAFGIWLVVKQIVYWIS
jgi:hypothetical protein